MKKVVASHRLHKAVPYEQNSSFCVPWTWAHRFLQIKLKILAVASLLFFAILAVASLYFMRIFSKASSTYAGVEPPVILWWTPFTGEDGSVQICGSNQCVFTNDRSYINYTNLKAVLFYGSGLQPDDMPPAPASPTQRPLWGLLHEESPKNKAMLQHAAALSLFNLSATFSRHSHFPLTLQHLSGERALTGADFLVPLSVKKLLQGTLAPVVYVQSDCDTPSQRDSYVKELMKHIDVDSYGTCLQNKQLPDELQDPMETMNHVNFWQLLAQYKFILAFENAICEDYITEKLWRPLVLGSIPIYYGSPSVEDWLPHNNSIIKVTDFSSPKQLADYIRKVNDDDKLYKSYLDHKYSDSGIDNEDLASSLKSRTWGIEGSEYDARSFVSEFECFMCDRVHELLRGSEGGARWRVNADHYRCPPPVSPLSGQPDQGNWWLQQWHQGRAEAHVLRRLVTQGESLTHQQFYEQVGQVMLEEHTRRET